LAGGRTAGEPLGAPATPPSWATPPCMCPVDRYGGREHTSRVLENNKIVVAHSAVTLSVTLWWAVRWAARERRGARGVKGTGPRDGGRPEARVRAWDGEWVMGVGVDGEPRCCFSVEISDLARVSYF
jgi:hypothetical protein